MVAGSNPASPTTSPNKLIIRLLADTGVRIQRSSEAALASAAAAVPTIIAHGPGVRVVTIGEAATRLGKSRTELEAMIARGQVETLPIEFGRVVPTREVERMMQHG